MHFSESKTYRNLRAAYEGELRAAGKYALYAETAREQGLAGVAAIFDEAARNEREHAKRWLDRLNGGEPLATLDNLRDSAHGEFAAWSELYRRFAQEADDEGFHELSRLFERVADVERRHNKQFCGLADRLSSGRQYCRDEDMAWLCLWCGHMHAGRCAPQECPLCGRSRASFAPIYELE